MQRVLPARSIGVVVPRDERGDLTAAVLKSQRIGLEPHLHIETESILENAGVGRERQAGRGVWQARCLERALFLRLSLLVSRPPVPELGAVVARGRAEVVIDDARRDAAVERRTHLPRVDQDRDPQMEFRQQRQVRELSVSIGGMPKHSVSPVVEDLPTKTVDGNVTEWPCLAEAFARRYDELRRVHLDHRIGAEDAPTSKRSVPELK